MKPAEIITQFELEGGLKNPTIDELTDWVIDNKGKEGVLELIPIINEDDIFLMTPVGKKQGKKIVNKLKYGRFFNGLGIKCVQKGWFDESRILYETLLQRTPNDIEILNNYGVSLLQEIEIKYRKNTIINKPDLDKSRNLIFRAYNFDKEVYNDWRDRPAYKNLCYLRAIESMYYYNLVNSFTAFVLAWLSIEMSLYRIWYQYLSKNMEKVSISKMRALMRWDPEFIIQTLYLSNFENIKEIKNDLDTMRGIRNKLFHGDIDNPSIGQANRCLETAINMTKIIV